MDKLLRNENIAYMIVKGDSKNQFKNSDWKTANQNN